jgi:membrane associated rhomboid family serine protease
MADVRGCHPLAVAPTIKDPDRPLESRERGVLFVAGLIALMWVEETVDQVFNAGLDRFGIRPRSGDGLDGIVLSPFLHADFGHLLSNTVPLLIMGVAIAIGGLARIASVTGITGAVGGAGTWLVAPAQTNHIGASGLVFGYAAYLISRGVFSRNLLHLGVGVIVAVVWGGALLGGLIPQDGISWQGHLFGAAGGIVAARVLGRRAARRALPAG